MRSLFFWDFAAISGQHIGPILKGQAVQACLTLEDGTDRLSETLVINYHPALRKIPKELGYKVVFVTWF